MRSTPAATNSSARRSGAGASSGSSSSSRFASAISLRCASCSVALPLHGEAQLGRERFRALERRRQHDRLRQRLERLRQRGAGRQVEPRQHARGGLAESLGLARIESRSHLPLQHVGAQHVVDRRARTRSRKRRAHASRRTRRPSARAAPRARAPRRRARAGGRPTPHRRRPTVARARIAGTRREVRDCAGSACASERRRSKRAACRARRRAPRRCARAARCAAPAAPARATLRARASARAPHRTRTSSRALPSAPQPTA